jgi:alkylhydroperoxidase family enzyme
VKPGRWWRAQNASVDNPKLIKLNDRAHRNWYNLNCVANEHGGVLPSLDIVAIKLRVSEARAAAAIVEMVTHRLFDRREDGTFVPHDWNQWQYKTDETDVTNADRQKRHRLKMKQERAELAALRDRVRNAPLRNAVTDVTAKRAEADKNITTTASVERKGLSAGEYVGSPSFQNSLGKMRQ